MIWTIIGIGWVVASVVVIVAQARELRRRERKYRLLVREFSNRSGGTTSRPPFGSSDQTIYWRPAGGTTGKEAP